ncbi:MAG: YHS domain-containing protein [Chloroflexota bacterium]
MMLERRTIDENEDPVCGMTVDPVQAQAKGLAASHEGTEYVFCGKGCLLEFRDDPEHYLDPSYAASM